MGVDKKRNFNIKDILTKKDKEYIESSLKYDGIQEQEFNSIITAEMVIGEIDKKGWILHLKNKSEEVHRLLKDFVERREQVGKQIIEIGDKIYSLGNYSASSCVYHEAVTLYHEDAITFETIQAYSSALLSANKIPYCKINYFKTQQFKKLLKKLNIQLPSNITSEINDELIDVIKSSQKNISPTYDLLEKKIDLSGYTKECKYIDAYLYTGEQLQQIETNKINYDKNCVEKESNKNSIQHSENRVNNTQRIRQELQHVKELKQKLFEEREKIVNKIIKIVDFYNKDCPALKLFFLEKCYRHIPHSKILGNINSAEYSLIYKQLSQLDKQISLMQYKEAKQNIEYLKQFKKKINVRELNRINVKEKECNQKLYLLYKEKLEQQFESKEYKKVIKTISEAIELKVDFPQEYIKTINYIRHTSNEEQTALYIKELEELLTLQKYQEVKQTLKEIEGYEGCFSKEIDIYKKDLISKECDQKLYPLYKKKLEEQFESKQYKKVIETFQELTELRIFFPQEFSEKINYIIEESITQQYYLYIKILEEQFESKQYQEAIKTIEDIKGLGVNPHKQDITIMYYMETTSSTQEYIKHTNILEEQFKSKKYQEAIATIEKLRELEEMTEDKYIEKIYFLEKICVNKQYELYKSQLNKQYKSKQAEPTLETIQKIKKLNIKFSSTEMSNINDIEEKCIQTIKIKNQFKKSTLHKTEVLNTSQTTEPQDQKLFRPYLDTKKGSSLPKRTGYQYKQLTIGEKIINSDTKIKESKKYNETNLTDPTRIDHITSSQGVQSYTPSNSLSQDLEIPIINNKFIKGSFYNPPWLQKGSLTENIIIEDHEYAETYPSDLGDLNAPKSSDIEQLKTVQAQNLTQKDKEGRGTKRKHNKI